jgi:hypothetical protein
MGCLARTYHPHSNRNDPRGSKGVEAKVEASVENLGIRYLDVRYKPVQPLQTNNRRRGQYNRC